jgi:hypothetical protein
MMPRIQHPRRARLALAVALLVLLAGAAPTPAAASDEAAVSLADRVVAALGGREAWDRTAYVAFDFVASRRDTVLSRRSLAWDKASNRIRLAAKDGKGRAFEVWTDLAHQDGVVLVDGAPADSATKAQWLKRAHAIWVNDTYWLLMPFKLHDPGVTLVDRGADSTGRGHVVELSFAGVGLTPGDRYRVHVDDETRMVSGWEMLLESSKDGRWKPATWTGWRPFGELVLADVRHIPDDQVVIKFENLTTARTVPAGAFDPPPGR